MGNSGRVVEQIRIDNGTSPPRKAGMLAKPDRGSGRPGPTGDGGWRAGCLDADSFFNGRLGREVRT